MVLDTCLWNGRKVRRTRVSAAWRGVSCCSVTSVSATRLLAPVTVTCVVAVSSRWVTTAPGSMCVLVTSIRDTSSSSSSPASSPRLSHQQLWALVWENISDSSPLTPRMCCQPQLWSTWCVVWESLLESCSPSSSSSSNSSGPLCPTWLTLRRNCFKKSWNGEPSSKVWFHFLIKMIWYNSEFQNLQSPGLMTLECLRIYLR